MPVSVESLTLEVIDTGIVQESRHLGSGRWTVGESPRIELVVGAGGCWVEGAVKVNGQAVFHAELARGDVLSFGESTLRVWPSDQPLTRREPLKLEPKRTSRPGLSVELWWQGTLVEEWHDWSTSISLPESLLAIEGYGVGKRVAMREGDSYRFFVPAGCEASEPVEGHETIVPQLRPLIIERRGLQFRVSLTHAKQPKRILRLLSAVPVAVLALSVTLGCDFADFDVREPFVAAHFTPCIRHRTEQLTVSYLPLFRPRAVAVSDLKTPGYWSVATDGPMPNAMRVCVDRERSALTTCLSGAGRGGANRFSLRANQLGALRLLAPGEYFTTCVEHVLAGCGGLSPGAEVRIEGHIGWGD